MLVLLRDGEVLLEKRPPIGIWGGLWSFPELPVDGDVGAHCAAQLCCEVDPPVALEPLRHSFTHFTLDIRPFRCDVRRVKTRAGQPGTAWFTLKQVENGAVPALVRKLLRRLHGGT
jgi:A/G-specific adenine glycosylase